MRTLFVAAFVASASAFNAPASKAAFATARPAVSMPRVGAVAMQDEPSDKAITIGAACVGGIVGVYFFGDLGTAVFLAVVGAYGSTLSNGFGSTTKSAGTFASKAYSKTLEINEQYDVLPKAKSALDTGARPANPLGGVGTGPRSSAPHSPSFGRQPLSHGPFSFPAPTYWFRCIHLFIRLSPLFTVSTAAANLDSNYGITAKIDEQLKLSQAIDNVSDKIDEVKSSVTSKVDDLKSKASSPS